MRSPRAFLSSLHHHQHHHHHRSTDPITRAQLLNSLCRALLLLFHFFFTSFLSITFIAQTLLRWLKDLSKSVTKVLRICGENLNLFLSPCSVSRAYNQLELEAVREFRWLPHAVAHRRSSRQTLETLIIHIFTAHTISHH